MGSFLQVIAKSPAALRVAPFCIFAGLTFFQGRLGESSPYWIYLAKTVLGAGMIVLILPRVRELRLACSWEAVAVGIGVFVVWVALDPYYPKFLGTGPLWNPLAHYPEQPALAWLFLAGRLVGSSVIVPPLEELFYRSFLYRWIVKADFDSLPLRHKSLKALLLTSLVFGVAHFEWLPGILCGFAYQGLVLRKNRLGDAIAAHAITNALLGIWVVWKGAWHFW